MIVIIPTTFNLKENEEDKVYPTYIHCDWTSDRILVVSGPKIKNIPTKIKNNPTHYYCFSLFFTEDLWEVLVKEINKYYQQIIA